MCREKATERVICSSYDRCTIMGNEPQYEHPGTTTADDQVQQEKKLENMRPHSDRTAKYDRFNVPRRALQIGVDRIAHLLQWVPIWQHPFMQRA